MVLKYFFVACFYTLLLVGISQSTAAEELSLTSPSSQWFYYQSHNPVLDTSQLKPSDWKPARVPAIFLKNPKDGIYLWYKTSFDADIHLLKTYAGEPLSLYIESIRNADETWLNGKKIGQVGEVSPPWSIWQRYPLNIPRVYDIPDGLLKPKNNTLLIKINTGIGDIAGTEYFGSVGITGPVSIARDSKAREAQYKINLKGNIIDVMIIVLGFIDIFLIIFLFKSTLHHIPEFPWLLLNSILMIAATLMLDVYYLNGVKYPVFGFIRYITVFGIPIVTALYFWSQRRDIPTKVVIIFGVIQVSIGFVLLAPDFPSFLKGMAWKGLLVLAVVFFLYALYSAIRNLLDRQVGSLAQFVGLLFYLFSIRTDIFHVDLFAHRNVYIGALFFRYALLLAYFQRIRHMGACYKTLSKRMLGTIEKNRSEMARELHDGLGQHLASSKFQAQLARVSNNEKHLSILTDEINSAVSSMHRLVKGLHPMVLERYHLKKAVKLEAKRLADIYSIQIILDIDDQSIPKEIEVHLFRIIQEGINNAFRHGKATKISIRLKSLSNKLKLTIYDNGKGYIDASENTDKQNNADKEGGFGIISLRERVNLINGRLKQDSKRGKGSRITVEIPL